MPLSEAIGVFSLSFSLCQALPQASDRKLMILNLRCMHNTSAAQSHTGCASQQTHPAPVPNKDSLSAMDVCPGTRCYCFPALIPAALHSA